MPNLTDKQLETVCRTLCKIRGLDPDEILEGPWSDDAIQWEVLKGEVRRRYAELQTEQAIKEVIKN